MARRKKKLTNREAEAVAFGILTLSLIAFSKLTGWWEGLTSYEKVFFSVGITVVFLSALGLIITIRIQIRRQRALAWKRAMSVWTKRSRLSKNPQKHTTRHLTDIELEEFAAQIYGKMGYRVKHTGQSGDHGVDVLLINPNKDIEIVQCKQWNKPVGEPQIRDLFGAMGHYKAVRGWLWAPKGFSQPAKKWAKGKSIVLADDKEIDCLIQSAYIGR